MILMFFMIQPIISPNLVLCLKTEDNPWLIWVYSELNHEAPIIL